MVLLAACQPTSDVTPSDDPQASDRHAGIRQASFGALPDGTALDLYALTNPNGVEVRVTTYGGIILSILAPDRDGELADVTLGFDTIEGYLGDSPYFGALIGRYGNRIAEGRFSLDGEAYELAVNNGPNALHGGLRGFDKVVWDAEPFERDGARGLVLRYTSPDGEEGYPGTLATTVTYTLTDDNALVVEYHATTDAATPVNLTQHTYFNLSGTAAGGADSVASILDHELTIHADGFTPVDETLIPTGEIRAVEGTPFDFRQPVAVEARIGEADGQIEAGGGYDHNFVLNETGETWGDSLRFAARVAHAGSGRTLDVFTTEPGLQVYSGNFLDGSLTGKGGAVYTHRTGLALETQHFPDSPNQPAFPSAILRPGETYRSRTAYVFGAE